MINKKNEGTKKRIFYFLNSNAWKSPLSALLFGFVFVQYSFCQGVIINEISQGSFGSIEEYVELLVVGSAENPTKNVNLEGWILDDNNGDFGLFAPGIGISNGHFILGNCLSDVPVGSLIVIYNDRNPNASMPPSDPNDSNGDKVYIIPASNNCIFQCNETPNLNSNRIDYDCTNAIPSAIMGGIGAVAFRDVGDAVQVRNPGGEFFHGFSYGTIPGTLSFSVGESQNIRVINFKCGNWLNNLNFISMGSDTLQSPGLPNPDETNRNGKFIEDIRNGLVDYGNLDNIDYCNSNLTSNVLPLNEFFLKVSPNPFSNIITIQNTQKLILNGVVLNTSNQKVLRFKDAKEKVLLDTTILNPGLYFLFIKDQSGRQAIYSLVKP